jgi:nudix-type nucleoside diphosphatase (YffH/AdpP family)
MDDRADVRIDQVAVLHEGFGTLRLTRVAYRRDGEPWRERDVETYDRGAGVAALLYDPERQTVLLARQFRLAARMAGAPSFLLEAPAGAVDDGEEPAAAAARELYEETGCRATALEHVLDVLPSPGTLAERLHLYLGRYDASAPRAEASGATSQEDVHVVELPFAEALALVASGDIVDAKTILLLQELRLRGSGADPRSPTPRSEPTG